MGATVRFSVIDSGVVSEMRGKGAQIGAALFQRVTAIDEALQAKITGGKLSGQLLKQRTGKLIGSVRVIPTTSDGGGQISGGVQAGGGPAYYARFQNYGTAGPYEIRPKDPKGVLAFMIEGKPVFAKKVIHPGLPARNFMESTLEESREEILASLQDAVNEAVKQ